MPRFRLLILAFTLVAVTVPASHAVAAPTCALDGGTGTLAVTVSDQGPVVFTRHLDAVWLDGAPCDSATVTNTDLIHVVASTSTTIEVNLTGGAFAPGISVEEDSASEIEFFLESSNDDPLSVGVVGTDRSDHFVVGQTNVGMMGADVIDLDGVDVLADADIYSQAGPGMMSDSTVGKVPTICGATSRGTPSKLSPHTWKSRSTPYQATTPWAGGPLAARSMRGPGSTCSIRPECSMTWWSSFLRRRWDRGRRHPTQRHRARRWRVR